MGKSFPPQPGARRQPALHDSERFGSGRLAPVGGARTRSTRRRSGTFASDGDGPIEAHGDHSSGAGIVAVGNYDAKSHGLVMI
jgi:hypothetical protein